MGLRFGAPAASSGSRSRRGIPAMRLAARRFFTLGQVVLTQRWIEALSSSMVRRF
jgi:hypothetical protein